MREIRFRAWDTFNNRMVMYPYLFVAKQGPKDEDERFNAPFIYYEDWQDIDDGISRPCHIMQFTGLKDKNGKEIYEGDIVKASKRKENYIITWDNCGFFLQSADTGEIRSGLWLHHRNQEVIGNIYEHSHLLDKLIEKI